MIVSVGAMHATDTPAAVASLVEVALVAKEGWLCFEQYRTLAINLRI